MTERQDEPAPTRAEVERLVEHYAEAAAQHAPGTAGRIRPEQTQRILLALLARAEAAEREVVAARHYLIGYVIAPLWGDAVVPLHDLLGVCTQVDNISTEILTLRAAQAQKEGGA